MNRTTSGPFSLTVDRGHPRLPLHQHDLRKRPDGYSISVRRIMSLSLLRSQWVSGTSSISLDDALAVLLFANRADAGVYLARTIGKEGGEYFVVRANVDHEAHPSSICPPRYPGSETSFFNYQECMKVLHRRSEYAPRLIINLFTQHSNLKVRYGPKRISIARSTHQP